MCAAMGLWLWRVQQGREKTLFICPALWQASQPSAPLCPGLVPPQHPTECSETSQLRGTTVCPRCAWASVLAVMKELTGFLPDAPTGLHKWRLGSTAESRVPHDVSVFQTWVHVPKRASETRWLPRPVPLLHTHPTPTSCWAFSKSL